MLAAVNVTKSYKVGKKKIIVNNNVNLDIKAGSLVWIYGNSGAGKSTFLNLITGLDAVDSGQIFWDGLCLTALKSRHLAQFRREQCGLVFQFFELLKTQSAYSNAALTLKLLGQDKKTIESALNPLFERYGLSHLKEKKAHLLSGGEQQRIAIVRALASSPRFIVADEITASLDVSRSQQIYTDLRNHIKQKNGVGVFVSHDPLIKDFADEVYTMKNGEAVTACS